MKRANNKKKPKGPVIIIEAIAGRRRIPVGVAWRRGEGDGNGDFVGELLPGHEEWRSQRVPRIQFRLPRNW